MLLRELTLAYLQLSHPVVQPVATCKHFMQLVVQPAALCIQVGIIGRFYARPMSVYEKPRPNPNPDLE